VLPTARGTIENISQYKVHRGSFIYQEVSKKQQGKTRFKFCSKIVGPW
jgi:hypothetical protein